MKIRSNLKEGESLILPKDAGEAVLDFLRKNQMERLKDSTPTPLKSENEEKMKDDLPSKITKLKSTSK